MLFTLLMVTMVASENGEGAAEGDVLKIAEGSALHKDASE
jgi:hypothetical protein